LEKSSQVGQTDLALEARNKPGPKENRKKKKERKKIAGEAKQ
jgi:hypothetical protein